MTHEEDCLGGICDCDNPIPISRPVTPHDELLAKINYNWGKGASEPNSLALRTVVELHKPDKEGLCAMNCVDVDDDGYSWTQVTYPCPTIQAIEKELE